MRKDHRPYFLKRFDRKLQKFYTSYFIEPQLDHLGRGAVFMKPRHVEIFGAPVEIGDFATVIAAPDKKVRLSIWSDQPGKGFIRIGDCCLICPGVRMGSSCGITIGDGCMFASGAYITDSDWHGIYDRTAPGKSAPVTLASNVWVGDQAIICKGVTIGENSIIGAGAVVTKSVPPNAVAAGNPAEVVRFLDEEREMVSRSDWFADPGKLSRDLEVIDRDMLKNNTVFHWIRHLLYPKKGD